MPKVRVEYEHDVCVGTAACSAADPKHFEMLDDGKSHIIDSNQEKLEKWARRNGVTGSVGRSGETHHEGEGETPTGIPVPVEKIGDE